jgi:adhesin transport system membrane fusion protein
MAFSDNPAWMEALARDPGLSELRPLRAARATLIILSVAVFALIGWAGFTPVNVITRGEGSILPSGDVQVIQHLEGGMVQAIHVREGQTVEKGDILLVMNQAGVASDMNQLKQQWLGLQLERERTQAYLENRAPDFGKLGASMADVTENHAAYASKRDAKTRDAEVIRAQVAQRQDALRSLQVRAATLADNIKLSAESLAIKQTLYEKGYYSRLNYLDKQEAVNSMRGELATVSQEIRRTRGEIAEYENRLEALEANSRDAAYETLTRLNADIAKTEEGMEKYRDRLARLEVRAPAAGIIKGVEVNTIGGIVGPGQKLMELVPRDAVLTADVRILPSDVGQLHVGLPVRLKVHAFDYTRYGPIEGTLDGISATTFVDENREGYYRGTVTLANSYVGRDPTKNHLVPGMTVDAEVIAGSRSLLSYLLKPLRSAADTAFTEY